MSVAKYIEYMKGVVPEIEPIKPQCISCGHDSLETPNLSAKYLQLCQGEIIEDDLTEASSNEFFVLEGKGKTESSEITIKWNKGDIFVIPYENNVVKHVAYSDVILFRVDDKPLLKYLGCKPEVKKFAATHFLNSDIMKEIEKNEKEEASKKRNRNGVLLTTDLMIKKKLNTITHTMWSLYNCIAPNSIQQPHKHNSVAIDLCIDVDEAADGLVYTLMGKHIDENNKIIDPIKMVWKKHNCFTTPPGWWHSHHNESNKPAWVFPVQDAGLHTYMQSLDINIK